MIKKMKNMANLFSPGSVAVIGASKDSGKLGFHVMKSLTRGGFRGKIIPVNPGSREIMGLEAVASIHEYPGKIDLAIVVLPAGLVPRVFLECKKKGVKGIVLITAGFKEIDDPVGAERHKEIQDIAEGAGIPVIGPNTFGMISFHARLNASFTPEFSLLRTGEIALVSQSGGMSHLLGFMALNEDVGFSKIVGLGNRLNVDFSEMLDYLMEDPDSKVIALYIEGIDGARDLMAAAKRCGARKPMIAYKTGSAGVGDAASKSHTGSLAGKHEIYRGAFKQAGILPVDNAEILLDGARALAACHPPAGPGVAILSGQAGPGMAACDLTENLGLNIVAFTEGTKDKINDALPPLALRTNPVDMGPAWYDSAALRKIVHAVMEDDNVHSILLLMMFASANVDAVKGLTPILKTWKQRKPVIGCIVAPPGIWGEQIRDLETSGALVNYPTPERAAAALAALWHYQTIRDRAKGDK